MDKSTLNVFFNQNNMKNAPPTDKWTHIFHGILVKKIQVGAQPPMGLYAILYEKYVL